MHQWSLSKLQGVYTQQGVSTQRTTRDQNSRLRKGIRRPCLCLPSGACLWAWLLLGALTVPGAWSFLSEEQEELLVELHNHYRGQVSPSASAMLPLKWDPSLKVVAEGYAAKCVWNHNPELEDTGENLFASTGTMDLREALEKWFLEHLDYDFHNNSCDEEKMCGHYTQMVWADTHRVGCAIHLCNNMEGLDWEKVSFLVCNYYPAGNYEDERPYVEGDWCSRCPEKLQKCENNLCVAETVDDGEDDVEDDTEVWTDDPIEFTHQFGEEKDEEGVVPPPATTDPDTQTIATTASTTSAWESENTQPQSTPAPGTLPPQVHSTLRDEEEKGGEKVREAEEKARETVRNSVGQEIKVEVDIENRKVPMSSASISPPSLLLACVSGILTLRL